MPTNGVAAYIRDLGQDSSYGHTFDTAVWSGRYALYLRNEVSFDLDGLRRINRHLYLHMHHMATDVGLKSADSDSLITLETRDGRFPIEPLEGSKIKYSEATIVGSPADIGV